METTTSVRINFATNPPTVQIISTAASATVSLLDTWDDDPLWTACGVTVTSAEG